MWASSDYSLLPTRSWWAWDIFRLARKHVTYRLALPPPTPTPLTTLFQNFFFGIEIQPWHWQPSLDYKQVLCEDFHQSLFDSRLMLVTINTRTSHLIIIILFFYTYIDWSFEYNHRTVTNPDWYKTPHTVSIQNARFIFVIDCVLECRYRPPRVNMYVPAIVNM